MDEMTCDTFARDVGAWLEDEATPQARADLEAHAARCGSCATLLADLRRIAADARTLPLLAPSRDLWAGIEARIEAPVIPLADGASGPSTISAAAATPSARRSRAPRMWQFSTRWLAAAAVLLIATSSGITFFATQRRPTAEAGQWVVTGGEGVVRPAVLSGARATQYNEEIGELRRVIVERRAELDSATVATVERSLRVIDDAIAESRAALSSDPASDFLHEQLDRTLARKVELLRALANMPARS